MKLYEIVSNASAADIVNLLIGIIVKLLVGILLIVFCFWLLKRVAKKIYEIIKREKALKEKKDVNGHAKAADIPENQSVRLELTDTQSVEAWLVESAPLRLQDAESKLREDTVIREIIGVILPFSLVGITLILLREILLGKMFGWFFSIVSVLGFILIMLSVKNEMDGKNWKNVPWRCLNKYYYAIFHISALDNMVSDWPTPELEAKVKEIWGTILHILSRELTDQAYERCAVGIEKNMDFCLHELTMIKAQARKNTSPTGIPTLVQADLVERMNLINANLQALQQSIEQANYEIFRKQGTDEKEV